MEMTFQCNMDKVIELILWLSHKQPGIGFHAILKLFYFADKYHLNHYGRPVTGDTYLAMTYGPVGTQIYDLLKGEPLAIEMAGQEVLPFRVLGRWHVHPSREMNPMLVSESDIEAMEHAYTRYGGMDFAELTRISHADPAYSRAEVRGLNTMIAIADMVEESPYREELLADLDHAHALVI